MRKLLRLLIPPPRWRLPVAVALGAFFGLAAYVVKISNAHSYLSDAPETCINCHVMYPQYATWNHSSHREVATCNDCHVPQTSFLAKYSFKAMDGLRHSTIFTLRLEPQVIQIKEAGKAVVQANCLRCHDFLNQNVDTYGVTLEMADHDQGKLCWECHREVPHGRVGGLSSTPRALVPQVQTPVPEWLDRLMDKSPQNP